MDDKELAVSLMEMDSLEFDLHRLVRGSARPVFVRKERKSVYIYLNVTPKRKGSPFRLGIIGISFKLKPQFRQRGRIELPSRLGKKKPKTLLPQSKAQRYKQLSQIPLLFLLQKSLIQIYSSISS